MKCRIRLMLVDDETELPFAGIGVIRLMRGIEEHGSIHHAAKVCGWSYVKAWQTMNRVETYLGQPILRRVAGGPRGGGAFLTPFGKRFLSAFEMYQQHMDKAAATGLKRFETQLNKIPP